MNCWICGTDLDTKAWCSNFHGSAVHTNCKTAYLRGQANTRAEQSNLYFNIGGNDYPNSNAAVCVFAQTRYFRDGTRFEIVYNESPMAGIPLARLREWLLNKP